MQPPVRIVTACLVLNLLALPAIAQVILNPSFEEESDGLMPNGANTDGNSDWGMPDHWSWRGVGHCNGHGQRGPQGWATDGEWCLYMFAMVNYDHFQGDFLEWYQDVDLTNIDAIFFDVRLGTHNHTAAYFAVDGQALWSSSSTGEYHEVFIDVTGYNGLHEIAAGVMLLENFDGPSADGHTWWDNLQVSGPVARDARTWGEVKALFD